MTTLHLLFSATVPDALPKLFAEGDALLLLGAGVSAAWQWSGPCFALDTAAHARGLGEQLPAHCQMIDRTQWLALVLQHHNSVSWA